MREIIFSGLIIPGGALNGRVWFLRKNVNLGSRYNFTVWKCTVYLVHLRDWRHKFKPSWTGFSMYSLFNIYGGNDGVDDAEVGGSLSLYGRLFISICF